MSRFIEANRKRFEAMKKPILTKRDKVKTKTMEVLAKLKEELAELDKQLESIQAAEKALLENANSEMLPEPGPAPETSNEIHLPLDEISNEDFISLPWNAEVSGTEEISPNSNSNSSL